MKKVILILALMIPVIVFSQTRQWNLIDTIKHSMDTVYYPEEVGDIAGFPWTMTVVTEDMDDTIYVSPGGSNNILSYATSGKSLTAAFEGIPHDSIPYTFISDNCQVITNEDTTVQKTFRSGDEPLGYLRPGLKLTTGPNTDTDTVFVFKAFWIFAK